MYTPLSLSPLLSLSLSLSTSLSLSLSLPLVVLSLLYAILETVRREDPNDCQKWVSLRSSFLRELENPVYGDETLTSLLFVMLLSFCNGTMPHYPVKKILLLLWKSVLSMMGGMKELLTLKQEARVAVSLEPSFPENIHSKPLVLPQPNYDPRYVHVWLCSIIINHPGVPYKITVLRKNLVGIELGEIVV